MAQEKAQTGKVVPLKPLKKKKPAAKAAKKTGAKAAAKPKVKATPKPKTPKKNVKAKAPKAAASKKASPKKPARKAIQKAAAKKTPAKKAAPKKAIAKRTAPKKPAARKPKVARQATQPRKEFLSPTPPPQMETIMTQSNAQFDQFTKDAAGMSREGVDAFVKSGQIFAKGFEAILRESMAFAQASAEKQMQFAKEAMTSKTINEFSDIQNKIAQSNFDDFMSGATKISELGVKVFTDAVEPINEQVTKSVHKASRAVAAE